MEADIVEHQGTRMIVVDYRGAESTEAMLTLFDKVLKLSETHPDVRRTLVNVTGTHVSKEFIEKIKEQRLQRAGYSFRVAMVGIVGIQNVILRAIMALTGKGETKLFETVDEAKDWLSQP